MIRPLLASRSSALVTTVLGVLSPRLSTSFFVTTPSPHLSRTTLSMSTTAAETTKKVLVPIAHGSEEIETTCITDTLVRFGAEVTIASANADGSLMCTMSRGIKVEADVSVADAVAQGTDWDLVVVPGGLGGSENCRDCAPLVELLRQQKAAKKLYGAICAAPAVVLATHDLLGDGMVTSYPAPGFREKIADAQESNDDVVIAGNLITSQGPGTALAFALELGEQLFGKEKRDEIAKQMLFK